MIYIKVINTINIINLYYIDYSIEKYRLIIKYFIQDKMRDRNLENRLYLSFLILSNFYWKSFKNKNHECYLVPRILVLYSNSRIVFEFLY